MIASMFAALALQAATQGGAAGKPDVKADKPAPAAADSAKPAPEKKICKTDTSTGSHIPAKICKTKAQWDALAEDAKLTAERMGDQRAAAGLP